MGAALPFNLKVLAVRCEVETLKFHARLQSEPAYCLEIWRRALQEKSVEAWALVQELYASRLCAWFGRHSSSSMVRDEREELVSRTFEHVYETNERKAIEIRTLAGLLSYVHRALNTTILERVRELKREGLIFVPIDLVPERPSWGQNPERRHVTEEQKRAFWERIRACTNNEREWQLVALCWREQYKPGEVVADFPDEFPSVEEIYTTLANALARVKRRYRMRDELL